MKRLISIALVFGVMFGALGAAEAKKKNPKRVTKTLFFHGTETVGEIDLAENFGATYNRMDTTEPTDPAPKSLQFTTWAGDPQIWNDCAGSYLLPVWLGAVEGRIVGDLKATLHTVSGPKAVTVQVWPDVSSQTCASNDFGDGSYPEPAAEATVDLPMGGGETEVVIKNKKAFRAHGVLTLMILPHGPAPGRVLYDSPDSASSLEFTCIPKSGKSCTK